MSEAAETQEVKRPAREQSQPLAYTIREACRVSGLGRTKLYEAINAGRLIRTKVGKRSLIKRENLIAFIDGRNGDE